MFPVSILVATCAMLSGIGEAALFTPIFILIFPLLGPEYVLESTIAVLWRNAVPTKNDASKNTPSVQRKLTDSRGQDYFYDKMRDQYLVRHPGDRDVNGSGWKIAEKRDMN